MPVEVIVNACPYSGFKGEPFRACPDFEPFNLEQMPNRIKQLKDKCVLWDSDNGDCHKENPTELFGYNVSIEEILETVDKRIKKYRHQ